MSLIFVANPRVIAADSGQSGFCAGTVVAGGYELNFCFAPPPPSLYPLLFGVSRGKPPYSLISYLLTGIVRLLLNN